MTICHNKLLADNLYFRFTAIIPEIQGRPFFGKEELCPKTFLILNK